MEYNNKLMETNIMMNNNVEDKRTELMLLEPWGGQGGTDWTCKLQNPIKEIVIAYGRVIDSIMFRTTGEESQRFGGTGGDKRIKVTIEKFRVEYLTGIRGTLGHYAGFFVEKSLCFITNLKSYGPFGTEAGGTPFSLVLNGGGSIVGFHGHCGSYLDAIGVYFLPVPTLVAEQPKGVTSLV